MRIVDYQGNRTMNDVGIFLSIEEAEDLIAYLRKLVEEPSVQRVHLSEINGSRLEKELTIALDAVHAPIAEVRTPVAVVRTA
jgi:hypothetical protein